VVGRNLGGMMGSYSLEVTALSTSFVPEVGEVQEIPSDEVSIVPPLPTAMKVLFP
tara:strand:- start:945 stop:1109 length:165 start_codon:yes stop_codon:yes gene_type:complete